MFKPKVTAPATNSNVIEFDKLWFTYSPQTSYSHTALKDVSLKLNRLEIIGVTGATGCGKSTLVQHVNGLLKPTRGQIRTHGMTITAKTRKIRRVKELRRKVSLVFQYAENQLFEDTVLKDLVFGPTQFGQDRKTAEKLARYYIKLVGLDQSYLLRSPFNLSGGEKRRVAIAGVLAIQATTLVLDEPTAGLDPQGTQKFLAIFKKLGHQTKRRRLIIVGHNLDHLLSICDRLVVLNAGRVVADGVPAQILSDRPLLEKLGLTPPLLYDFAAKLTAQGLDLSQFQIRTIADLVAAIKRRVKTKATVALPS